MSEIKSKYSKHPLRKWIITQSLDFPLRTILLSLLATIFLGSGIRFFIIDDDMMKILRHEIGSASSIIRNALDQYLPSKMEEVHSRIANRKRQTLQALQLQEQRAQVDNLESAYATRSEDFKSW